MVELTHAGPPQARPELRRARISRTRPTATCIDAATPDGLLVRRAPDGDPRAGQRSWTAQPFRYAHCQDAELSASATAGFAAIAYLAW